MASFAKWYGDKFLAILNAELNRRISACVIAVANRAKKLISIPGTGQRIRKSRAARYNRKKSTVYGFSPSAPGDPPRKQTGELRKRVAFEVHDTAAGPVGRAGTNVKYGPPLELGAEGTRDKVFGKKVNPYHWRLAARPWLRRALTEMTPFIRAVMSRPMKL